jgi:hypothetical protein
MSRKQYIKMVINFDEMPKNTDEVEQVELFKLNGKSYTIPNKARANVSLKYLNLLRKEGDAAASAYLLTTLLGEEAFDALTEYDDLTTEQFTDVVGAAQKVVLGELDNPKGKK